MNYDLQEAVDALNSIDSDWYKKIDLERLNMHCAKNCIIGQLFGHYTKFFRKRDEKIDELVAMEVFGGWTTSRNHHPLTKAWKDQILAMRQATHE